MVSIEEVSAWTLREIQDSVLLLLPKTWKFTYELRDDGLHEACILRPAEKKYEVVWTDAFSDERLVLLGAYGFLFTRNHKPHLHSPWVRRSNPARDAVRRRAFEKFGASFGGSPDPEDLNPQEVQSVYEKALGKKKI